MPLAHIVADMFASGDAKGPAMMLWDKMEARKEKRWYRLRDRDSPRVARMLDGYVKWLGNFVALDESVRKNVKGDGEGHWQYWMDDMELWRRKDT
jgi:IMP cyclohydrolase